MHLKYPQYAPNQGVLNALIDGDKLGDFETEFSIFTDDISPMDKVVVLFTLSKSPMIFDLNDNVVSFPRLSKWKHQIKAVTHIGSSDLQFGIVRQQLVQRLINGIATSVHRSSFEAKRWICGIKENKDIYSNHS